MRRVIKETQVDEPGAARAELATQPMERREPVRGLIVRSKPRVDSGTDAELALRLRDRRRDLRDRGRARRARALLVEHLFRIALALNEKHAGFAVGELDACKRVPVRTPGGPPVRQPGGKVV